MNKTPKIFFGTMYCEEPQIDKCCEGINLQKGISIFHLIIENKREIEAHNILWNEFNSSKEEFDMLVKIDADTVLIDENKIKNIYDFMKSDSDITGIQIYLHDYFTDDYISGLNCFSPKVWFEYTKDELKPDRVDRGHVIVLQGEKTKHLAPAGLHCPNPNIMQAFHYGLHRQKKGQIEIINKVKKAYEKYNDESRKWALIGASYSNKISSNRMSYKDKEFMVCFEDAKNFYDK